MFSTYWRGWFPWALQGGCYQPRPRDPAKPTLHYSPLVGRGRGWTQNEVRFGGCSAERGIVGKGEKEKNPLGLLPKNTTRRLFSFAWSSPVLGSPVPCCPRCATRAETHGSQGPRQWHGACPDVLCARWLQETHRGTRVGLGVAVSPEMCFCLGCFPRFPPKVQPVRRLTPLGTAGLISSPWQLFMLLSGNYSFA